MIARPSRSMLVRAARLQVKRAFTNSNKAAAVALNFDDTRTAFQSKSTSDLVLQAVIFQVCGSDTIVKNSDKLMKAGQKVLGKPLMKMLIKPTFFKHFCAGEDAKDIVPRVDKLRANGIGGILDYAAEADVDSSVDTSANLVLEHPKWASTGGSQSARTYSYVSERECDENVETFLKCIQAVKDTTPEGFAAIKLTALGNPLLLERISGALVEIERFFQTFDKSGDGRISYEDFKAGWIEHFQPLEEEQLHALFEQGGGSSSSGSIDYVDWTTHLSPLELPQLVSQCLEEGPLSRAAPTEEELQLMGTMMARLDTLARMAQQEEVRLMVDAEQTYFQPAIRHIVVQMQRKYNTEYPTVFNTYQCYLKETSAKIREDLERARRDGFKWGAKLVRGAYLVSERQRATEMEYADPTHATIADTHACYNECVRRVLQESIGQGEGSNLLIASHNQQSVEEALALMHALRIPSQMGGVYFGQLLGMADHLSFTLGAGGYKVYKYVPYGAVDEVMPYLIRRAQENSGMMGSPGVQHEAAMVRAEILRRNPLLAALLTPAIFGGGVAFAASLHTVFNALFG